MVAENVKPSTVTAAVPAPAAVAVAVVAITAKPDSSVAEELVTLLSCCVMVNVAGTPS